MKIIVRGGGDLATGTIYKLFQCGFKVLILETDNPTCIRRKAAFSEAIIHQESTVEGVTCKKANTLEEANLIINNNQIPIMIDPMGTSIKKWQPDIVVDAILAKQNLGTTIDMAKIVIGLGPGFEANKDVHAVIETKRGHHLGRIYYQGTAIKNTGIPGLINGFSKERVIHAPVSGKLTVIKDIEAIVQKNECIAKIDETPVYATLNGVIRGMLPNGFIVSKGLKMADIDPRQEQVENCTTISDKARCIAGGVLEAILHLQGNLL